MFSMKPFMERFGEILSELDALAEDQDSEELEDLNAELEDAMLLLSELNPRDAGDMEELTEALEDIRALAGDYRALAKGIPGLEDLARRLDMAAQMALGEV